MAIELGPVAIMESPAAASDKVTQRNKANAVNTTKTDKSDQMDKADNADNADKMDKSEKSAESSPNRFMALLAEFDIQELDSSSPLTVADAKLLAEQDVAEKKVVDPTGGLLAGQPPVLPALDPSSLLGQMQIGLAGHAVNPSLISKLPVQNEPLAQGSIQESPGATLAKRVPKSSSTVVGDGQAEVTKSTDISQTGVANAKLASVAEKQPLTQSLQATLNATMAVAQNAVSRAEKSAEGSTGGSPTATLGESFRQLVGIAKSDKPAEITTSISHSSTTERTQTASLGGWDFSTSTVNAKAISDGAGASPSSSGFSSEAQGANQVAMWVSQNVQSAELKLDAQGADPVEVSISLSGGEAQVQFRSDVAETRDMLSRAVADLDSSLQREGLVLSGVSVGTSAQGQDKSSEPGENGAASRQFGQRARDNTPANALRLSVVPRALQGSVDLFV